MFRDPTREKVPGNRGRDIRQRVRNRGTILVFYPRVRQIIILFYLYFYVQATPNVVKKIQIYARNANKTLDKTRARHFHHPDSIRRRNHELLDALIEPITLNAALILYSNETKGIVKRNYRYLHMGEKQ